MTRARAARFLACALVALVVAGCASQRRAPVEDRGARPATPPPPVAAPATPAPGAPPPAVAGDTATTYVVKRGDTLLKIALDNGLDYRELAAWNNVENVNVIRVGQVLRLTAPGTEVASSADGVVTTPLRSAPPVVESKPGSAPPPVTAGSPGAGSAAAGSTAVAPAVVARNTDSLKASPKAFKEPYSEQALRDAARPEPVVVAAAPAAPGASSSGTTAGAPGTPPAAATAGAGAAGAAPGSATPPTPSANAALKPLGDDEDDRLDWVWPAKGKLVGTFSETANLKGIDIAGAAGTPVLASAAGTVVYAGTGLRGYGKLIIVKHNKTYLSAYAHNREILVKEGEKVTKGQKIAEMGNTDASEVKLHFEIRRMGKPMDPVRYLPPA